MDEILTINTADSILGTCIGILIKLPDLEKVDKGFQKHSLQYPAAHCAFMRIQTPDKKYVEFKTKQDFIDFLDRVG